MEIKKNCEECMFAVLHDTGYSNYTVEGSDFICSLGEHPDGTFDRWYGEDKKLEYAEQCKQFHEGGATELDVDGENLYKLPVWRLALAQKAGVLDSFDGRELADWELNQLKWAAEDEKRHG